jgi:hypothetical protein
MIAFLSVIVVISLMAIIPTYVAYFASLYEFGKSLQESHPDIYSRYAGSSVFTRAYSALEAIRADPELLRQLDPDVAAQLHRTYRNLLVGLICFMILLFAGLGISLDPKI